MSRPFDAIVLLGVELDVDDRPTDELRERVRTAVQAYRQGLSARIVASGGQLPGHARTEAETMADLLQEAGVPRQAVLTETRSQDTMENFRCTAALLGGARGRRVLVVTSDYHLCRAVMTARRVGLRAKGRAAVLPHDGAWRTKRCRELLYTLDLIAGWQDEGRCRPRWTYALLDRLFPPKKEKADKK